MVQKAKTEPLQIKIAVKEDLPEILALDRQLFGEDAWPTAEFMKWWEVGAVKAVTARRQGTLLGFADAFAISEDAYRLLVNGTITSDLLKISDAEPTGICWWVGAIAVETAFQRQNIGRTVWKALNEQVAGKVCADIWSAGGGKLLAGSSNWQLALPGYRPIWTRIERNAPKQESVKRTKTGCTFIMNNNCVFCDRTKFVDRIITENSDWYVIATLGQIVGGYVLIIPKDHVSCMGALTSKQSKSMSNITKEVSHALCLEYLPNNATIPCPITMFEHGVVGQTVKHAHLHILPVAVNLTAKIKADFPKSEHEELQAATQLCEIYSKGQEPYLFWTTPNGKTMICKNPPAPGQYMRLIVAELLDAPERGEWSNISETEIDRQLIVETVARLKPYFHKIS
jgi:diadenosine tetraphosphate (Ap4A) HIT family hydrolase